MAIRALQVCTDEYGCVGAAAILTTQRLKNDVSRVALGTLEVFTDGHRCLGCSAMLTTW